MHTWLPVAEPIREEEGNAERMVAGSQIQTQRLMGMHGVKAQQELTWRAKVCAATPCCDVKALPLIFTLSGSLDLQFSMPLIYTSSAKFLGKMVSLKIETESVACGPVVGL